MARLIKLEYPSLCWRCKKPVFYVTRSKHTPVIDAEHKFELRDPWAITARGRKIHECRK